MKILILFYILTKIINLMINNTKGTNLDLTYNYSKCYWQPH